MHFNYKPTVYKPKKRDALDRGMEIVAFEPKDYAYIDSNTLIHVIDKIPAILDLLKWASNFDRELKHATGKHLSFYLANQNPKLYPIELWKSSIGELFEVFLNQLNQIKPNLPKGEILDPLFDRILLFRKAVPNWSIDQIKYNSEQLCEIISRATSTAIGLFAYSDEELKHPDTSALKAIAHPALKYFQRETRDEVLKLYTLGAALHLLQNVCNAPLHTMTEFGKARAVGECERLLDCQLPKHPDHLEVLLRGAEIIRLSLKLIDSNSSDESFTRGFTLIRAAVSILQTEIDYVSFRHHGTQNIFENGTPIQEETYSLANDYHSLALSKLDDAVRDLNQYLLPVEDISMLGAKPIFKPIEASLSQAIAYLEGRNRLIIDPLQFVRIRIFSKDHHPTREILREAQTIQRMRLAPDALLSIQSEKELRAYIESGRLSYISVSVSDKQLAFFAISTDQNLLTESGEAAIKKLSELKRYKDASFAFVELVASDVNARYRLKPWARGAWSFVSAAGESLALNSYEPEDRVVLALIARDGIAAEAVYRASGFNKTKQYLKLKFAGGTHRYYIWAKELGGEIVSP